MIEVSIRESYSFTNLTYSFFYYLIAGVLLFSGVSKIIDPAPMIETMKAAFKVNESLLILAATFLPITEIVLGLMLVLKIQLKKTLLVTTVLFFGFFLFSVYGTVIGLNTDCGCFGNTIKSEFGLTMIVRNLVLVTIILCLLTMVNKKFAWPG